MIRRVEHPTSTTYHIEVPFHLIKTKEELKNVLGGINLGCVIKFSKIVDDNSFMPFIFFVIINDKSDYLMSLDSLFYVASVDLIIDGGYKEMFQ